MRCIQDTTRRACGFSAFEWDGPAPDAAFAALGAVLSRRLHITAGQGRSCCGAMIDLVAVEPGDPTLPPATRSALRELAPGRAIAARTLAELAGGWIAMPGVDIRVGGTAELGGPAVAITFDDAVALLQADGGHRLLARTVAVVETAPRPIPRGWRTVLGEVPEVPLLPGHQHGLDHLPGCAA
jgi:hypothetical protein